MEEAVIATNDRPIVSVVLPGANTGSIYILAPTPGYFPIITIVQVLCSTVLIIMESDGYFVWHQLYPQSVTKHPYYLLTLQPSNNICHRHWARTFIAHYM